MSSSSAASCRSQIPHGSFSDFYRLLSRIEHDNNVQLTACTEAIYLVTNSNTLCLSLNTRQSKRVNSVNEKLIQLIK